VNCSKDKPLCLKLDVEVLPELYIYFGKNKKVKVQLFEGLGPEFLIKQNIDLMEKKVTKVTSHSYFSFLKENVHKPIILVFTERASTSILFLSLAKDFKDKVAFGEVNKSDQLVSKFGVTEFPTVILVEDGLEHKGKVYTGKPKKESIIHFITENAFHNGKFKANLGKVVEFTKQKLSLGTCGPQDNSFCFIAVVPSEKELNQYLSQLESLKEKYSEDGISFYYVLQDKLHTGTHRDAFANFKTLILRSKRSKFTGRSDYLPRLDLSGISSSIDNLLSGSLGSMQNYKTLETLFV